MGQDMRRLWVPFAVVVGACGCADQAAPDMTRFVNVDDAGQVVATVMLRQPLPSGDTSFQFTGPGASSPISRPMTFERVGPFQCHWSDLIVICRTAEESPVETRMDDGRYVRRLNADTIVVANAPGGPAGDFATFGADQLIAFGTRNESGAVVWRYDAR